MTFPVLYESLRRRRRSPILENLAYYWTLNESSGQRFDSVGGNHLTDPSSVGAVVGKQGNAASFASASSDYLSGSTVFAPTTACTWAVWYRPATLVGLNGIFGRYQVGNIGFVAQQVGATQLQIIIATSATDTTTHGVANLVPFQAEVWTHIMIVFDGSGLTNADRLKFYINGSTTPQNTTYSGTIPDQLRNNSQPFVIGAWSSTVRFNDGALDEFGVWTVAQPASAAPLLYNGGSGITYPFS